MAVHIRKLSTEEAAVLFPKRGQMDLSEYTAALRELRPGDAAEVEMGGLTSRALKRRVGQAARQMGYSLKWARETGGSSMRFLVRQDPTADSRAPRRGRPRKTADGVA